MKSVKTSPRNDTNIDQYIRIWEKSIETQMHFNEMSVKTRQLGLTFVAAALGIGIFLMSRGQEFVLDINIYDLEFEVHVAVFLLLAGCVGVRAVEILDLGVYHRMLRGAVTFGCDFERAYMTKVFQLDKGMTEAITHYSRFDDASVTEDAGRVVYTGKCRKSAEARIRKFYRFVEIALFVSALVILFVENAGSLENASERKLIEAFESKGGPNETTDM